MPRRFFRRVSHEYMQKDRPRFLRWFDAWFAHPTFLSVSRRSVAGAVWVGLFTALMPIPGQTLVGIMLALVLRVNVPIAAITTWVTNPVTMWTIFYSAYSLGALILDLPPQPFNFEMSLDWISTGFLAIWKPLLLGCFIAGTIAASLGYLVVSIIWRVLVAARYRTRHANDRVR